jgi:PAS domain S-box-containing protein
MVEMQTSWDYRLVTLSVVIAIIGSFVALDFAGRMKSSRGPSRKLLFVSGALMMGLAIWSMHFVGMLALIMPMPITYNEILMGLSILAAVTGSAIAFAILNRQTLGRVHMITGSIAMGLAISAMHYMGMASMQMAATIHYNPILFLLSITIAISASAAALWIAFRMRRDKPDIWFWQKIGSAVVMGFAVSGMHYTGMVAAHYYHIGQVVSGFNVAPTVGSFRLSDLLIAASVLFGGTLLVLTSQAAGEKQKALKIAQENEARFLGIFEQAAVGLAQVGLTGEWLRLNQKYCEILGYHHDELPGMTFQEMTYPDDLETDVRLYQKLLASEIGRYTLEKRYIRKDRSLIWINLTVSLVRDEQNKPLYAIAVAEDISERKNTEESLRKSLEREQIATEIINSIRSETDLNIILRQTITSVGQFIQADRCLIWLYDSEAQQFQIPQQEYRSSVDIVSIENTAVPHCPALASVLSQTEATNITDAFEVKGLTEENRQLLLERGIKSLLNVPILYKEQLLGALQMHSVFQKRTWDVETTELLKYMAAQVAVAIYHAKTLQDLRDSEARKSSILESSLDAIITIDETGKVCEWNTAAERIFGYPCQEALGKEMAQLILPEQYRESHRQGLTHYLATGEGPIMNKLLELPALRADGREFPSELTIRHLPLAGPSMFTGTLRDITERKEAKQELERLVVERTAQLETVNKELRTNEERFRLLVETVKDYAILRLDPNGIIQTWNQGAERLKGYKASEIIGQHFSKFYTQEAIQSGYPEYELKTIREQGRFEDEGWRVRKDGSKFWANVIMTALYDENGNVTGFTKITRDLTERKRIEEDLRESAETLKQQSVQLEAVNKELEAFSYSVSHDLRAPLRTIDGFSQAILGMYQDKLDDRGKDYLNRVREGSQQMAKLIDDMLQLSRLTRGELSFEENIDLSTIVRNIAQELIQQAPYRQVVFDIEDGIIVSGDRRLLQAVLQNLIGNSWKYTSKHPTAHIEFGQISSESRSIYYVKDDGAGFDMKYANKLFGAFQRLHGTYEFEGTGVGLATVARIIHRHGGQVWTEAEVEKGATFFFTLEPTQAKPQENIDETEHTQSHPAC